MLPNIALSIGSGIVIVLVVVVLALFSLFMAFLSRYKRCPSDKILVIYGSGLGKNADGTKRSSKCLHGGASLVWPVIQAYRYLDLTPIRPQKRALPSEHSY